MLARPVHGVQGAPTQLPLTSRAPCLAVFTGRIGRPARLAARC